MEINREYFALCVVDGVDYLANIGRDKIDETAKVVSFKPVSNPIEAITVANLRSSAVGSIAVAFREMVEEIIINNMFVIGELMPSIKTEQAIKVAFRSSSLLKLRFSEKEIETALSKTLPKRF